MRPRLRSNVDNISKISMNTNERDIFEDLMEKKKRKAEQDTQKRREIILKTNSEAMAFDAFFN